MSWKRFFLSNGCKDILRNASAWQIYLDHLRIDELSLKKESFSIEVISLVIYDIKKVSCNAIKILMITISLNLRIKALKIIIDFNINYS
jgi:hypothetical protein